MPSSQVTVDRLRSELVVAQAHLANGEQLVLAQQNVVTKLERGGYDASDARQLLATMIETQRLHGEHLNLIQQELELATDVKVSDTPGQTRWISE